MFTAQDAYKRACEVRDIRKIQDEQEANKEVERFLDCIEQVANEEGMILPKSIFDINFGCKTYLRPLVRQKLETLGYRVTDTGVVSWNLDESWPPAEEA